MGAMPAGLDGNRQPLISSERTAVLGAVAEMIVERRAGLDAERGLLVAVDGIDGAGKSTFADELTPLLRDRELVVIRSTIDWFHQPRQHRRRKGERSAIGFYEDSHDLDALRSRLLDPLLGGRGHRYRIAAFDEPTDRPLDPEPADVTGREVLLFDGIFLLRPELSAVWDLSIFLDGQERVQLTRVGLVLNDLANSPAADEAALLDRILTWVARLDRYSSGMQIYLDSADPVTEADVVVDNNDLLRPRIVAAR